MFSQNPPDTTQPKPPDTNVPSPVRRTDVGIKTLAFVEKSDLEQSIVIDGAVDEKLLLGNGDQVYVSYPKSKQPVVGKRYSIYVPGQPVGGFGSYVRLMGTLEIVCRSSV